VANVDGPLGDRTPPKATQRLYREASHLAEAPSVRKKRLCLPTAFHSWGGPSTRTRGRKNNDNDFSNFVISA
jgi:hypothetical protein